MSKRRFTESEVAQIRKLLQQKSTTSKAEQKKARAKLRKMDFRIDEISDLQNFTEGDFDDLVENGTIEVVKDE